MGILCVVAALGLVVVGRFIGCALHYVVAFQISRSLALNLTETDGGRSVVGQLNVRPKNGKQQKVKRKSRKKKEVRATLKHRPYVHANKHTSVDKKLMKTTNTYIILKCKGVKEPKTATEESNENNK